MIKAKRHYTIILLDISREAWNGVCLKNLRHGSAGSSYRVFIMLAMLSTYRLTAPSATASSRVYPYSKGRYLETTLLGEEVSAAVTGPETRRREVCAREGWAGDPKAPCKDL